MDSRERAGWLAGATGVAALGAVAAGGVARNVARRRRRSNVEDPNADQDFTAIYRDAATTVTTDDGLALAVRTVQIGDTAPELTVLFVHGFSLRMASWHFQRFALEQRWQGKAIRMVFFDHRGHGASDPAPKATCTIDRIADDAAAVLRAVAPTGPVVLAGHSMGGMAIMALARRHQHLFEAQGRVVGVALVATAERGVADAGIGAGLSNPLVGVFRSVVRRAPGIVQTGRGLTRQVLKPVLVAASFGSEFYSPAAGRAVEKMINSTPIDTLVNFLQALENHDESMALPILARVPTVVVCGDADRLTHAENSLRMYGALGEDSELVLVPGAGHLVLLEEPEIVTDAIDQLVLRARAALPPPRRSWWRSALRRGVGTDSGVTEGKS